MHYARWRLHGETGPAAPKIVFGDPEGRFWSSVNKTETCWLWTGPLDVGGYAKMFADGRQVKAHRYAYELLVGPIPEGLQLDHLCRVRHCVRAPDHLEPVTARENVRRGVAPPARQAAQTHCLRGHEFTPENTYVEKSGKRKCKACRQLPESKAREAEYAKSEAAKAKRRAAWVTPEHHAKVKAYRTKRGIHLGCSRLCGRLGQVDAPVCKRLVGRIIDSPD